jgi:hypothetical protein
MKTPKPIFTSSLLFLGGLTMAFAQGSAFTYQGRLHDGTGPANGNYEILFRPFGVFTGGSQLTIPNIRLVAVSNGLFTTTMDFGPVIFAGGPVYLQLEVRTNGGASYTSLVPRQQLTPSPYAIFSGMAGTVPNGAIGTAQLAADAVTTGKLAPGAVTSATLADTLSLGNATNVAGRLDIFRTAANTRAISLIGSSSLISINGRDGLEQVHLDGGIWGTLWLNNGRSNNERAVTLTGNNGAGGHLSLHDSNGLTRASLTGGNSGGSLSLVQQNGDAGLALHAEVDGHGGGVFVYDANGTSTVELTGAEGTGSGSQLVMKQANGTQTVQIDAEVGSGGGGYLRLYKGDGSVGLTLQADVSGESKVTTQVLQITGGSDLSEQFDIKAPADDIKPGTLVCIDSQHPGQLILSTKAYDRTVAGVMSGAGGVKPGMLMGQQGTVADGRHPVALTGRVYCRADASNGPIYPGDLLTTSNVPGHAMRVTDYHQAQGAVIGKAMSSLERDQGLVLVLVSLQ